MVSEEKSEKQRHKSYKIKGIKREGKYIENVSRRIYLDETKDTTQ